MDLNQEKEQKLGQIKERVNELYPLGRSSQGLATFNELTRAEIVDNCVSGMNFLHMVAEPRLPIDTGHEKINKKLFDEIIKLLSCPICLNVLQDPVNVKSCLHLFCNECIEKYNRQIKKECPTCRTGIPTRRQLRPDTKLTNIIKLLIPSWEDFAKHEAIEYELAKKNWNYQASIHQPEEFKADSTNQHNKILGKRRGPPLGVLGERVRKFKMEKRGEPDKSNSIESGQNGYLSGDSVGQTTRLIMPSGDNSITFKIRPDPGRKINTEVLEQPVRTKLRTVPQITILQMQKFVAYRLAIDGDNLHKITFFVAKKENKQFTKIFVNLEDRLMDINNLHWTQQNRIQRKLYYVVS